VRRVKILFASMVLLAAAAHASSSHLVCNEHYQFCLEGCYGDGAQGCAIGCFSDYLDCEALFLPD
jgi:hypothetical protein